MRGHPGEVGLALVVDPVPELLGAERLLAHRHHLGRQLLARQADQVAPAVRQGRGRRVEERGLGEDALALGRRSSSPAALIAAPAAVAPAARSAGAAPARAFARDRVIGGGEPGQRRRCRSPGPAAAPFGTGPARHRLAAVAEGARPPPCRPGRRRCCPRCRSRIRCRRPTPHRSRLGAARIGVAGRRRPPGRARFGRCVTVSEHGVRGAVRRALAAGGAGEGVADLLPALGWVAAVQDWNSPILCGAGCCPCAAASAAGQSRAAAARSGRAAMAAVGRGAGMAVRYDRRPPPATATATPAGRSEQRDALAPKRQEGYIEPADTRTSPICPTCPPGQPGKMVRPQGSKAAEAGPPAPSGGPVSTLR